ncbi:hypothetical protein BASA84_001751 [Batrachochytrium salamandrivorans]|nr:hypothetical protein BASA84_001751 [Batrachochytrium salamandrivorans]
MKQQNPREPIRLSSRKQLSSARQFSNFDTLDMDMMKTVDCKVHECDESDDVARGVLGRLENMVLAPRAFASWDSAFGSAIHADTFFIDCGADDVFMDAELATRLNIPLVKIPVPIKLRLADGDSSSMITPSHSSWKAARTSDIRPRLASRNKSQFHRPDILICRGFGYRSSVLFKEPQYGSRSGMSKSQYFRVSKGTSNQFHLPKQSKPNFDCTINLSSSAEPPYGRIYQLTPEEDKVMQEWISENLAKGFYSQQLFSLWRTLLFRKQKDKLRLCMDYRGLNKQTLRIEIQSRYLRMLRTYNGKIFTTLDLRGAYNLLRIKRATNRKQLFTKYGQFEFLAEKCHFYQTESSIWAILFRQWNFDGSIQDFCCPGLAGSEKLLKKTFHFLGDRNKKLRLKVKGRIVLVQDFLAIPTRATIYLGNRCFRLTLLFLESFISTTPNEYSSNRWPSTPGK